MSKQDIDSKKKSASEAFVNSFGGYPIGYGVGIVVLPLSMGWIQEDPLTANLAITLVYAVVSFVRSYFLRRTFEKYGIDDNFIRVGISGIKKANTKLKTLSLFSTIKISNYGKICKEVLDIKCGRNISCQLVKK